MKGSWCCLLIVLLALGCSKASSPQQQVHTSIESWADMGIYLPDAQQVDFFQANLTEATPDLTAALSHPNTDVRQRAAYVIAEIGTDAAPLGPALVKRLEVEPDRLVRIYLVEALAAVMYRNDEIISLLRKQFDALDSANVPPQQDGGYAEVDEKINLAAAMFVLTEGEQRTKYMEFVTQWLQTPNAEMNPVEIAGYWQRRLIAVISLEGMPDATEAIPLLESMLQEENPKPWVLQKVPRVLAILRKSSP